MEFIKKWMFTREVSMSKIISDKRFGRIILAKAKGIWGK